MVVDRSLSVPQFLKTKKNKIACEHCEDGVLSHKIVNISSMIEKSKDQMIIESKEEIRKTVDKIRAGDSKTINDVYGDKPNPYKNTGVI
jgi:hypothetical protein